MDKLRYRFTSNTETRPLVGPGGVVFIVRQSEPVVVTLYPLEEDAPRPAAKPRLFRLKRRTGTKPVAGYLRRRQKEQKRAWKEIDE